MPYADFDRSSLLEYLLLHSMSEISCSFFPPCSFVLVERTILHFTAVTKNQHGIHSTLL